MMNPRGCRAWPGALRALIVAGAVLLAGCGGDETVEPLSGRPARATGPEAAAPRPDIERPRIVALGDSLTAGLGLSPDEAYPARLEERLKAAGYDFEVVNQGLSGDTSAGGLRRLDWALRGDVRILILALGANDGLRGLSAEEMERNLSTIIERAQARGIKVLLTGMEAPPNFGAAYTAGFRDVYRTLAARYEVTFVPFLLDGVAAEPSLNQRDGIHPNAEGARLIAEHLWPALEPMLSDGAAAQ